MKTNAHFFISLSILVIRNVSDKRCRENQNIYFWLKKIFPPKIVCKNIVWPSRPQMTIWRMRSACWIPNATDTHSEYVTLIAFPLQQLLREHACLLRHNLRTLLSC